MCLMEIAAQYVACGDIEKASSWEMASEQRLADLLGDEATFYQWKQAIKELRRKGI
jgi:hypothetical protein